MIVVGAGIVGLAVGWRLLERQPGLRVTILEKELRVGAHQTGHNSGVIHRGLYYRPGSLNAELCATGADQMLRFCRDYGVKHRVCGKLVVAIDDSELSRLGEIERRARANLVPGLEVIGPERIIEIEPLARGVRALYSPHTAIVDYAEVAHVLVELIEQAGGEVRLGVQVDRVESRNDGATALTPAGDLQADWVVACAGLQSDRLAGRSNAELARSLSVVPFRGGYRILSPRLAEQVRGMVYPVPDPRFPFLGIHATRRVDGTVWIGPNAVLALAREGYGRRSFSLRDAWAWLSYPGFWRLAARYWRVGTAEMWRDANRSAFSRQLQRLMPSVSASDLSPGPCGIRAQALARDGTLLDGFAMRTGGRVIHVINAPSPAATASFAIGDRICDRVEEVFGAAVG